LLGRKQAERDAMYRNHRRQGAAAQPRVAGATGTVDAVRPKPQVAIAKRRSVVPQLHALAEVRGDRRLVARTQSTHAARFGRVGTALSATKTTPTRPSVSVASPSLCRRPARTAIRT
jgi:hypothetical protein